MEDPNEIRLAHAHNPPFAGQSDGPVRPDPPRGGIEARRRRHYRTRLALDRGGTRRVARAATEACRPGGHRSDVPRGAFPDLRGTRPVWPEARHARGRPVP